MQEGCAQSWIVWNFVVSTELWTRALLMASYFVCTCPCIYGAMASWARNVPNSMGKCGIKSELYFEPCLQTDLRLSQRNAFSTRDLKQETQVEHIHFSKPKKFVLLITLSLITKAEMSSCKTVLFII